MGPGWKVNERLQTSVLTQYLSQTALKNACTYLNKMTDIPVIFFPFIFPSIRKIASYLWNIIHEILLF